MRLFIAGLFVLLASVALIDFIVLEHTNVSTERAFKRDADSRYQAGFRVYKTHCQTCHGDYAEGKGSYTGLPADMNIVDFTSKDYDRPKKEIKTIIREGGASLDMNPIMPAWKSILSESEIADVTYFIKTINKDGQLHRKKATSMSASKLSN